MCFSDRSHALRQVAFGLLWLGACTYGQIRRFPLAEPRWEDADRSDVAEAPEEYYSGQVADLVDKSSLRPLARLPYLPLTPRAYNVNALDEVPNSSWFQNRLGLHDLTAERVAAGACAGLPPLDTEGPWEIYAAKPNGANPGFFVESRVGRFLLKFDGEMQPQRPTAADVIGSRLYWAAGYHAPCNEIVYFDEDILTIADDATAKDALGVKQPISSADLNRVLAAAFRRKDGTLRAMASRLLSGGLLGPFRYQGTRGDDPNDHIPHEYRRELRGGKILAAWLQHHDAREQNTMDVWVEDQGRHYVRHYMLDFGDCLGGRWELETLSPRTGHTYVLDWEDMAVDYVTLGMWPRPWYRPASHQEAELFGHFTADDFWASRWKPDSPNSAFIQARHDDELWMARIIARFTEAHLRAVVAEAQLEHSRDAEHLVDALRARQRRIMEEYFTQYTPLADFRLVRRTPGDWSQSLCFEDLAISHGVVDLRGYTYKAKFYGGEGLDRQLGWLQFQPDLDHPAHSCLPLPMGRTRPADLVDAGAPADHPLRYGVLKIWVHTNPAVPTSLIRLYFYDLGRDRGYRLVGVERPERPFVSSED